MAKDDLRGCIYHVLARVGFASFSAYPSTTDEQRRALLLIESYEDWRHGEVLQVRYSWISRHGKGGLVCCLSTCTTVYVLYMLMLSVAVWPQDLLEELQGEAVPLVERDVEMVDTEVQKCLNKAMEVQQVRPVYKGIHAEFICIEHLDGCPYMCIYSCV